jgi:exodeoxyribonuclease VII small subunit
MSSSSKPPLNLPPTDDWRYETVVAEVESIISQIESGELELEDVFEQFTQAVTYLKQCETFLTERQAQVDLLVETLEDAPVQNA